jgi:hypothetical protein
VPLPVILAAAGLARPPQVVANDGSPIDQDANAADAASAAEAAAPLALAIVLHIREAAAEVRLDFHPPPSRCIGH